MGIKVKVGDAIQYPPSDKVEYIAALGEEGMQLADFHELFAISDCKGCKFCELNLNQSVGKLENLVVMDFITCRLGAHSCTKDSPINLPKQNTCKLKSIQSTDYSAYLLREWSFAVKLALSLGKSPYDISCVIFPAYRSIDVLYPDLNVLHLNVKMKSEKTIEKEKEEQLEDELRVKYQDAKTIKEVKYLYLVNENLAFAVETVKRILNVTPSEAYLIVNTW